MLQIRIPGRECYNEARQEFIELPDKALQLEHSLVSISKWESKWCKPFLSSLSTMTNAELIDYIRCMTISQNVQDAVYYCLTDENLRQIQTYINAPMTATTFRAAPGGRNQDIITAEVVYYWMISYGIPFECQKWHFNRLMTLIRVCSEMNAPGRKKTRREILQENRALNRMRKARLNSRG